MSLGILVREKYVGGCIYTKNTDTKKISGMATPTKYAHSTTLPKFPIFHHCWTFGRNSMRHLEPIKWIISILCQGRNKNANGVSDWFFYLFLYRTWDCFQYKIITYGSDTQQTADMALMCFFNATSKSVSAVSIVKRCLRPSSWF
jgi:hypothetical protein